MEDTLYRYRRGNEEMKLKLRQMLEDTEVRGGHNYFDDFKENIEHIRRNKYELPNEGKLNKMSDRKEGPEKARNNKQDRPIQSSERKKDKRGVQEKESNNLLINKLNQQKDKIEQLEKKLMQNQNHSISLQNENIRMKAQLEAINQMMSKSNEELKALQLKEVERQNGERQKTQVDADNLKKLENFQNIKNKNEVNLYKAQVEELKYQNKKLVQQNDQLKDENDKHRNQTSLIKKLRISLIYYKHHYVNLADKLIQCKNVINYYKSQTKQTPDNDNTEDLLKDLTTNHLIGNYSYNHQPNPNLKSYIIMVLFINRLRRRVSDKQDFNLKIAYLSTIQPLEENG